MFSNSGKDEVRNGVPLEEENNTIIDFGSYGSYFQFRSD